MSTYYALPRRYPGTLAVHPAVARDRSVRRRLFAAWGLLYLNTMTFVPGFSVLDIPSKVGKGIAQAALPLAIVLLLTVNPRLRIRPSLFLCLVSALAAETVLTAVQIHHLGTAFRTFRMVEFAIALWLLTPWFGRPDMLLLRYHVRWLYVSLGLVFLGLVISPGKAFAYDGRLTGAIWPMVPTQIAQYAAMAAGITAVLWLGRQLRGPAALGGVLVAVIALVLTHTRTGLLALLVGIVVAGLSLFTRNSRVRRFFAGGTAVVLIGAVTVAGVITTWLARGQTAQGITSLTGRTNLWSAVLNTPRTGFQEVFGFGLSNAGVNGLPIDSNWLSSYMQEGVFGVVVCALILVFLFGTACFRPSSPARASALFIVTYCAIASFTEDAFTDVSTYLLGLAVAASLLAAPALRRDAGSAIR